MGLTQTGKRKAATLLMNLDSATASELLQGLTSEKIEELAVEMAQINTSDRRNNKEESRIVREFQSELQKGGESQSFDLSSFLNETLVNVLGEEKAQKIQAQVNQESGKTDIFKTVRSADTDQLALALKEEHPQMAAVILSELEPKKVQSILMLLDKKFCCKIVWKMAKPTALPYKVKQQMVAILSKKLESFKGETAVVLQKPKTILRELAIMLSDVERGLRSEILDDIKQQDEETATMISNLMVTWEDLLSIADRSLQEALRAVETQKLAIAMHGADEEIVQKICSNLSERAVAALEEEKMLMQEPLEEEITEAREKIISPLRKANEEGKLRRVQE
jgi:flagellar motor switch protein FliG